MRGVMPLPVPGHARTYNLGIWAEVSRATFQRILDLWDDEHQSAEPALPGQLANAVPFHASTLGLALEVRLCDPANRPQFFLKTTSHLLYQEQLNGIPVASAERYTALVV